MTSVTTSIIGGMRRLSTIIQQKVDKVEKLVEVAVFNTANLAAERMITRINDHKEATRADYPGGEWKKWQTGNQLAGSIMVDPPKESLSMTVGTRGVPHAVYYEYGTGERGADSPSPPKGDLPASAYTADWKGMRARPYAHPTAEEMREELPKAVIEAVKRGWK